MLALDIKDPRRADLWYPPNPHRLPRESQRAAMGFAAKRPPPLRVQFPVWSKFSTALASTTITITNHGRREHPSRQHLHRHQVNLARVSSSQHSPAWRT